MHGTYSVKLKQRFSLRINRQKKLKTYKNIKCNYHVVQLELHVVSYSDIIREHICT